MKKIENSSARTRMSEILLGSLRTLPKSRLPVFLGVTGVILVVILLSGYRLQVTGSSPRGIWQFNESEVTRGAWVAICPESAVATLSREREYLSGGPCAGDVSPMLKRVAALSGDTVEIHPSGVAVNSTPVPRTTVRDSDREGRPMPHPDWGSHIVAPGTVWVINPGLFSFDSRYFGPVEVSRVLSVVDAVLLFDEDDDE